jgi:hypothetical protein
LIHSLAAFARLCATADKPKGVSKAAITQGVTRGLLVKTDDGKIDDQHPMNALFLARHSSNAGKPTKPPKKPSMSAAKPTKPDPEQAEFRAAVAKRQAKKLAAEEGMDLADLSPAERKRLAALTAAAKSDLGDVAQLPIEKFKADIALKKAMTQLHEFKLAERKGEVIHITQFQRAAEGWNTNLSQSVMRIPRRVSARLVAMVKAGADKTAVELELEKACSAAVTRALEATLSVQKVAGAS